MSAHRTSHDVGPDLRLYLVTDPSFGPDLREVVVPAVEGGVTCVQVRDKHAPLDHVARQVTALRAALDGSGALLLSNDVAVPDADGVHVGVDDVPPTGQRAALGPQAVVGWSIEDLDQLDDHDAIAACSYVAVSPVHATPTKTDTAPALGLGGVTAVAARLGGSVPVVAIGGMDEHTAAAAVAAGADGVAVVRAVGAARDPRSAARRLRHVVDVALDARPGTRA